MAALKASRAGKKIHLFDSNNQIGRKLLVTGSGRCNITNLNANPESYYCANPSFLQPLFIQYPPELLRKEVRQSSILTYATSDGWCYPVSESAATVVDALSQALIEAGVEFHLKTTITNIQHEKPGFKLVSSDQRIFHCDRLVVASGGKAYPSLGSTGALFAELQNLGHTVLPVLPALAPIEANISTFRKLQGVRLDVIARLWEKNEMLGESNGNLIITSWGFNGPAVMNLSHLVSLHPGTDLFSEHKNSSTPVHILLGAALPHKLPKVILQLSRLSPDISCDQLNQESLQQLWEKLTSIRFKVQGIRGFEFCQLKVGGVPLNEVTPKDFQSRPVPNLYLAGEVLDVVGPCGGYNLHFAFASGALVGFAIAKN
jgi:predicted Rossmann fold flavoprotein